MTESVRSNQNSGGGTSLGHCSLVDASCHGEFASLCNLLAGTYDYEHLRALRPGGSSALLFRFISLLAKGLNQLSWLTNYLRGGAVPNGHLAILPASVIISGEHQPWLQTCRTPLAGLTLVSRVNDKGTEGL